MLTVQDQDMPALFRVADQASNRSQRFYLRLVRFDLALIVAGALVTSWAVSHEGLRVTLAILGAGSLLGGLILTTIVFQNRPDQKWYGARAVAESAKTMAWRYMTRAEPYTSERSAAEVDKLFRRELGSLLHDHSQVGAVLGGPDAEGEQISETMRDVRGADLEDRKGVYLRDRIQDQRAWYASKAETNATLSRRWLLAVGAAQLGGAVAAIALIQWSSFPLNVTSVLAALAAAFMAWLQVKQHQELASAYGVAAQELGLVAVELPHIQKEEEFSTFVADAENAISREHTMWLARRDTLT